MFRIPIFTERKKPITVRCQSDPSTKLRLKFAPYYHEVEANDGIEVTVKGKKMVMMSSNEYLGLSQHPKVMEASKRAIDEWGSSACGSRLANGNRSYHARLEEELAGFLGKEAVHVTTAGYLACVSSLSSLAQRGDAIVVDKSIHSCLWDGATLSSATIERFGHEDMESLEKVLGTLDDDEPKIIVIDGVYSMEGHIANLPRIVELAEQHEAFLVVDDAHGFGVLGNQGRGIADHFGLTEKVDLIAGTFSKSLASIGGFIAADRSVIEYLRTTSRQIIFNAGPTPSAIEAARASLRVIQEEPEHLEKLWENTRYYHSMLDDLGLDFWDSPSPAVPIVIGNKEKCLYMWRALWEQGFFTVMSVAPGVPAGKDLIRTAVSSLHTREQLERFGEALKIAMKKAGVRPKK